MRNLKKILALVLALVMSLSLMATAGAAETTAAASNPYQTAQEVLEGLKVFQGNPGGAMNYDQSLTRVQAAALVYRIATSDVTDAQKDMYTNHAFKDVAPTYWGNGYIGYGYNAEIIKGMGDGTFHPDDNVTGYQVLAMILRTLGYGKNHEFEGTNWEVQTAATAKREGLLNGITAADEALLGQPASRGLVAQILFNALLQPTVKFSALNPYNYTKDAETLGYQRFTLQKVEGVVIANEYADTRRGNNSTLAAGKTALRNKSGDVFEIDTATGLDDLGMTHVAYVTSAQTRGNYNMKCLALGEPTIADNVTYDDGEKLNADNFKAQIKGSEAERYLNFGESAGTAKTNIKISYVAYGIVDTVSELDSARAEAAFRTRYKLSASADVVLDTTYSYAGSGSYRFIYTPKAASDLDSTAISALRNTDYIYTVAQDANNAWFYRVEIKPGVTYTTGDVHDRVIKSIFNYAGLDRTTLLVQAVNDVAIVDGEVYRGTQFVTDYSDTHSYEEFIKDCVTVAEDHINNQISTNERGWWLKIIDNDNDGVTDWVFQTRYTVAKVSKVNDDGTLVLDTPDANNVGKTVPADTPIRTDSELNKWTSHTDAVNYDGANIKATNESGETLEVGDVVYYARIDGVNRAWKSEVKDARVSSINRSALTVTVDGETDPIYESAVHEHSISTDIASGVTNMSGTVQMYLYLDKYGNLAAFSQNITGNLVLLTDGWARNTINNTEYAVRAWDSAEQALKQYNVSEGGNLFINSAWADSANSWNRIKNFDPLNTGVTAGNDIRTIVAYMETDGENAKLMPVDTVYDVNRQNGRRVAMIDLGTKIPGSALIDDNRADEYAKIYQTWTLSGAPYNQLESGTRVRALSNTLYYYVYQSYDNTNTANGLHVKQFEGYASGAGWLTAAEQAKYVEDVYMVGTRGEDVNGVYYTANVVVVELNDQFRDNNRYNEQVFIYNAPVVGTWATIEEVEAINAKGEKVTLKIDLTNSRNYTEAATNANGGVIGGSYIFSPGLYYLVRTNRTDSEGIWAVDRMTHDDIRDAGIYDVGDIVTSYNTLTFNYAQVRDYVCDTCAAAGVYSNSHVAIHNMRALASYANNTRKNVDGTSKYYELSYNSRGFGEAKDSTATQTLRQWYAGSVTSDLNHNQVLVRYNSSNEIVYAISFAHGDATTENFAQAVWRSVTKSETVKAADVFGTFYGVEFGRNSNDTAYVKGTSSTTTSISYNLTWKEAHDYLGKNALVVLKGSNWGSSNVAPVPITKDGIPTTNPVVVTINQDGKEYKYAFTVDAAKEYNTLEPVAGVLSFNDDGTINDNGAQMTIAQYIETVEKNQSKQNQTFSWAFFNDYGEIPETKYADTNMQNGEIKFWTVTVTSEAGVPNTYVSRTPVGKIIVVEKNNGDLELPDGTKIELKQAGPNYEVTVKAEPGVEPVIVVNGNVYRMKDLGVETKALSALAHTWTRTLTADEVGTDTVIYVRAIVGGDDPIDLPTADTPATDAEREAATEKLDAAKETLAGLTELDAETKAELDALVKAAEDLIADETATKAEIDAAVKAAEDAINEAAGITPPETYTVTIDEAIVNGTVTADPTSAEAGDEITLTVTPDGGYKLGTLTVTDAEENEVEVTDNKFVMPASNVTVTATFVEDQPGDVTELPTAKKTGESAVTVSWYNETASAKMTAEEIVAALAKAEITVDVAAVTAAMGSSWNGSDNLTISDTAYKAWTVTFERNWKVFIDQESVGYVKAAGGSLTNAAIADGYYLEKSVPASTSAADNTSLSTAFEAAENTLTIPAITENLVLMPSLAVETVANTTLVVGTLANSVSFSGAATGFAQIGQSAVASVDNDTAGEWTELYVSGGRSATGATVQSNPDPISFTIAATDVGNKAGDEAKKNTLCVETSNGVKVYIGTEFQGVYEDNGGITLPAEVEDFGKLYTILDLTDGDESATVAGNAGAEVIAADDNTPANPSVELSIPTGSDTNGILILVPAFTIKGAASNEITYSYTFTLGDISLELTDEAIATVDASNGDLLPVDADVTVTKTGKYVEVKSGKDATAAGAATAEALSDALVGGKDAKVISEDAKTNGYVLIGEVTPIAPIAITAVKGFGTTGSSKADPIQDVGITTVTNATAVLNSVQKLKTGDDGALVADGEPLTSDFANKTLVANTKYEVTITVTASDGYTLKDVPKVTESAATAAGSVTWPAADTAGAGSLTSVESVTYNAETGKVEVVLVITTGSST